MTKQKAVSRPGALQTILLAGFIAGSLDIASAFVQYYIRTGNSPFKILNYVASGLVGKESSSGNGMAVAGLLLHYVIAFAFTIFFFWIYPKWNLLAKNRWFTAIGYGLFVWVIMNLIVLPLTRIPHIPFNLSRASIAALILICMIGMPVTFIISNYYSRVHNR